MKKADDKLVRYYDDKGTQRIDSISPPQKNCSFIWSCLTKYERDRNIPFNTEANDYNAEVKGIKTIIKGALGVCTDIYNGRGYSAYHRASELYRKFKMTSDGYNVIAVCYRDDYKGDRRTKA